MFNFPPGNLSPGWTERQGVLYSQGIIVCSDSWDLQLPVWIKIFNRRVWFGQKVGPQKPTAVEDQPFLWAALLSLDFKKSRDPNDSSTKVFGNVDQKMNCHFFRGSPHIKIPIFRPPSDPGTGDVWVTTTCPDQDLQGHEISWCQWVTVDAVVGDQENNGENGNPDWLVVWNHGILWLSGYWE